MIQPNDRGYIYFARPKLEGGIKIGFSKKPPERLKSVESLTGQKLHLMGFVPGTPRHEKAIHQVLHHKRLYGEWFASPRNVNAFIVGIIRAGKLPRTLLTQTQKWIDRMGGTKKRCLCGRLK